MRFPSILRWAHGAEDLGLNRFRVLALDRACKPRTRLRQFSPALPLFKILFTSSLSGAEKS